MHAQVGAGVVVAPASGKEGSSCKPRQRSDMLGSRRLLSSWGPVSLVAHSWVVLLAALGSAFACPWVVAGLGIRALVVQVIYRLSLGNHSELVRALRVPDRSSLCVSVHVTHGAS